MVGFQKTRHRKVVFIILRKIVKIVRSIYTGDSIGC